MRTKGVNHLALVCRDMEETTRFYTEVMGMPLVKTVALGKGGQHFFFDCGGGDLLAFFWWENAPPSAPGVASIARGSNMKTAIASMNHVSFHVDNDELEAWSDRLKAAGVEVTPIGNHDDSEFGHSAEFHPGVYMRSLYFTDPNGIQMELSANTRALTADDVRHVPAKARQPQTA